MNWTHLILFLGVALLLTSSFMLDVGYASQGTMGSKYWDRWENAGGAGILLVLLWVLSFLFYGIFKAWN